MKKVIALLVLAVTFTFSAQAQDKMMDKAVKNIALEQTKGEFTQKTVTVNEGTYVFNVTNNNAGTDVGLVLVKKGQDVSKEANHIKTAYVSEMVQEGKTQKSKPTTLTKGEYVYFCPFNKTVTDNTLIVK
jgi:plastocyanin